MAGPLFVRLFLALGIISIVLTPLTFVMPNPDHSGALAEGAISAVGFLVAAYLARKARHRAALAAAAATLLTVAMVGATTLNDFDSAALGIAIVAAVLVLPAVPRHLTVPIVVIVGLIGSLSIGLARLVESGRASQQGSALESVVTAVSVLAITLAIVTWTHLRLVQTIQESNRIRSDLDASERRYRTLVESAPDGIVVLDPATSRVIGANGRAAEIFGFDSAAAILASAPEEVLPERQPDGRLSLEVTREIMEATLAGRRLTTEIVYRRRDGSAFTAELRSSLIVMEGRTQIRLSVTDISERVAALRARDTAAARFRSLFASSPNAVLVVDAGGRIVEASDRATEVFGYPAHELRGMPVERLVPSSMRPSHRTLRIAFAAGLSSRPMGHHREFQVRRSDGRSIPVEIGLASFDTDEGRFTTAVVVDLSARREAERAASEATETTRAVFDASPAGIAVTAVDGTIRLWNQAMVRMTGWSAEEMVGRLYPALPDEASPDRQRIRQQVANNETIGGFHLELGRKDDTRFPAVASFGPLHDADGNVSGLVAVIEDVTGMRTLEAQVNRKARLEAIGQLAGGIAHDINNVLTAISGFAALSLDDLDAGLPVDRAAIVTIADGAARTSALTRQLLAFARRDVRPAETLDLGASVRAVEPLLRGLIGEHIDLRISATDEGHVRIASSQVEQVVINLVVNARDALPMGGTIQVDVANYVGAVDGIAAHVDVQPGAYVSLTVTDNGTGMPPEVAERVFDPFFTTKGPDEGTGLGLATVHGIVSGAGGHVWLYSEVGVGTTFRIILPQIDAVANEDTLAPAGLLQGTETILLVEDEDLVRVLAGQVLKRAGFTVLSAANAEEALDLSDDHDGPIHLLLADVVMPRVQGPELAAELLRRRPGLPVLFMSGYTAGGAGLTASLPLDARFIDKPFSPNGLIAAVRATLDDVTLPMAG